MSFNLKVPSNWKDPDDKQQYADALKGGNATAGTPDPGSPPGPLFTPVQVNKHHCDIQKMHNAKFGAFIDKTCDAICGAWSQWQSAATMVGVMIAGPTASLGQVVGIPWQPLILAQGAMSSPMEMKYTNVIAGVISNAWMMYTASIKVPGLPWYPAFAACPSPVAPPMPNTPAPLMMLTQVDAPLQTNALKGMMVAQLADPLAPFNAQLFEAISDGFNQCFTIWKASTQIMNVIGTGPVPTFAPPYVPVGPVVGGVGTMAPGGFV